MENRQNENIYNKNKRVIARKKKGDNKNKLQLYGRKRNNNRI